MSLATTDTRWAAMQEEARAVRETERELARDSDLESYLTHAAKVVRFTETLRDLRMPIKAAFSAAQLNYQLARQAVTVAETVDRFEGRIPTLRSLGPSLVLLLNEAERRFEREDRGHELTDLLRDLSTGMSRRELREKYLPPRRSRVAAVLAALKGRRFDEAKRTFAECDPDEQGWLCWFSCMLSELTCAWTLPPAEHAGSTIDEALAAAVGAHEAASVAPCNPDDQPAGG